MKIPVFGLSQVRDSRSCSFKVISSAETINLHNYISNVVKLSVSSTGKFLNTFSSLDYYYTTILVTITIRIDYIDNNNIFQYHKQNLTYVVNICSGDSPHEQDCLIEISMLDLSMLNLKPTSIDLSLTFLSSLDT